MREHRLSTHDHVGHMVITEGRTAYCLPDGRPVHFWRAACSDCGQRWVLNVGWSCDDDDGDDGLGHETRRIYWHEYGGEHEAVDPFCKDGFSPRNPRVPRDKGQAKHDTTGLPRMTPQGAIALLGLIKRGALTSTPERMERIAEGMNGWRGDGGGQALRRGDQPARDVGREQSTGTAHP